MENEILDELRRLSTKIENIEKKLDVLVEQTAPPPTVKTKVKAREWARQILAESEERKRKREDGKKK
jgi:hypothetical protein